MFPTGGEPPRRTSIAIVGGGMAGLELAKELHRAGADDVLVLEAGPAGDPRHVSQAYPFEQALAVCADPEQDGFFHRSWRSRTPPFFAERSGIRRRLGGRSLYWWGITLPIEEWALCAPYWPAAVVTDLTRSWRGGPSLYRRVATDLGIPLPGDGHPAGAPVRLGRRTFTPTSRAYRGEDDGQWSAYSPLDHWRNPANGQPLRDTGGVRFSCGSEVLDVIVRNGRATGLRLRRPATGELVEVSAESVVLAAGTIESTRLALHARHAADPSAPLVLGGLVDHIVQGFSVTVDLAGLDDTRLVAGSFVSVGTPAERSNFFYDITLTGQAEIEVSAMGEQVNTASNSVECRSPGEHADCDLWITSALSAPDRELVGRQQAVLGDLWADLHTSYGLRADPLRFNEFDVARTPRPAPPTGVPKTAAALLGTVHHEGGTLRLGEVLDERHEFVAVPGLFATGPATFGRSGAANPTLTTLALSRRLAGVLSDGRDG